MKILLFGEYTTNGYMILGYYQRGFEALGHEVRFFPVSSDGSDKEPTNPAQGLKNTYPFLLAQRALKRVHNLTAPLISGPLVSKAIAMIDEFQPDVALTSQGGKSIAWPPALLEALNEKGVPIFNYFTDPVPEDDKVFLATIPFYAGIFTYNRHYVPTWYWYGASRVDYVPFASDHKIHTPKKPTSERFDYYCSPISYLATWQPNAELWSLMLVPYGLKIWGNNWSKLPVGHQLRNCWQGQDKGLYEEFALICSSSDIVFNVIRAFNGQGHSMKTFEIPACKGFVITNRTEQQLEFFPEDKACVYFSTAEELIDKTEFYLRNEKAREVIVEHAYQIASKHRYLDRARDMVCTFQEVL